MGSQVGGCPEATGVGFCGNLGLHAKDCSWPIAEMAGRPVCPAPSDRSGPLSVNTDLVHQVSEPERGSHLGLFGDFQRVVDFDAQVADR